MTRPHSSHFGGPLVCAGWLILAGCGSEPESGWIPIAREAESARLDVAERITDFRSREGRPFRLISRGGEEWLETTVSARDWSPGSEGRSSIWSAAVPIRGSGQPKSGEPGQRLLAEGRQFTHRKALLGKDPGSLPSDSFLATQASVLLKLGPDVKPPPEASLQVFLGRRQSAGPEWRVGGNRFSGDGFSLWPGESLTTSVRVPGNGTLRFVTCSEPLLAGASAQDLPIRYRVRAHGSLLFEYTEPVSHAARSKRHAVVVPDSGQVELRFEVQGALAYSSFLCPTIGPSQVSGGAARPVDDPRRDIIIFQADTFRADNLAAYGGQLGITPNLDRLAGESLLFRRSWSVSTHTLPAHASLFTGLYPHQTGVHGKGWALSEELQTIAEHLSRAGYRTGAVTDSVMVSHRFGMDQGFEWFDELSRRFEDPGLGSTLPRVRDFLDADDGRPIFLFIQTYRVHIPYVVAPQTFEKYGQDLKITGEFADLDRTMEALLSVPEEERDWPRIKSVAERLRGHYLGGVVDLDREFGSFHQELVTRGLLEHGNLIFTSDHGEAFAEHDVILHTGTVWEELARIPLFILGAGIKPGVVQHAAGLVDLAPTAAELAGLQPDGGWAGTSLLSLRHDRPAYVFQCRNQGQPTLAMIRGRRKIIGFDRLESVQNREIFGAYDLGDDPLELSNLHGSDTSWPLEMYGRLGPTLEILMQPIVGVERAALDAEKLLQLREMGYLGD